MDTKSKIKEAAYRLFEKESFSHITCSQIINESGVSRRTFYNHFPDKYELMYNYYEDLFVDRLFGPAGMPPSLNAETWEKFSNVFFDLLQERHTFYNNMTSTPDDKSEFTKFIYGYAVNFYSNLRKRHKNREHLASTEKVTIRAFCAAFISLVRDFMNPKMELTSQQATAILKRMIPAEYRQY